MTNKNINFDSLVRLVGALFLVLGVLFSVSGLENRTLSALFFWLALLTGFGALVGSYFGKHSWYGGIAIFLSAYLSMISRYGDNRFFAFCAMLIALLVGLGGLSGRFIKRNFRKSLFFTK